MLGGMHAPWWTQIRQNPGADYTVQVHDGREGLFVLVGDRQYYLVGIEKPLSHQSLAVTIRSHPPGATEDLVHKLDLQSPEACDAFVSAILDQYARSARPLDASVVRRDLKILRLEAKLWRDTMLEESLRSSRTIPEG